MQGEEAGVPKECPGGLGGRPTAQMTQWRGRVGKQDQSRRGEPPPGGTRHRLPGPARFPLREGGRDSKCGKKG